MKPKLDSHSVKPTPLIENRDRFYDIKKYLNYFLETKGFTADTELGSIHDEALKAAAFARGQERGPAIFIQGIMPRSGSVYVGELLRRHPDLCAYPYGQWEFPGLMLAGKIQNLQDLFLHGYQMNKGKLGDDDFLAIVGGGLMAYLHASVPSNKRVLVKMPSAQYLSHFFRMFPYENLLVLIRDGRDVVHSTLRTWKNLNFIQVCLRWNRSARMVITHQEQMKNEKRDAYWLARYEDALSDPEKFLSSACRHFQLDADKYPLGEIDTVRVIGSSQLENNQVVWRHLSAPKDFRPTGYWHKWSPVKKSIFKLIAGRSLQELGYCKDQHW